MLVQPEQKYRPFPPMNLPDRQWPARTIRRTPRWMSTDLRDGNQALFEPMNAQKKRSLFDLLVAIGFKEIEVGFPSASQTEYDFLRSLIEEGAVPDDVALEVLAPARAHLIERTFESLRGVKQAIIHIYNATAESFRTMVFRMDKAEVVAMAVQTALQCRKLAAQMPETAFTLEYSPEYFSCTEPDFALEICEAVMDAWGASPERPVIINLPATIEAATPNVYADQVEWMHRHLSRRDSVVLSVHPHNDRGTAIAAAELGLLAGADRIEGCLFGNGERTGNADLMVLALNLYTQGIDPGLDFSNLPAIARQAEALTQLPIHPRHPYAGDLVFTAFSGSHQDAIKKGFAAQADKKVWEVPYLTIDPADIGRSYDSVIRVNSQSGKGGIAYLMESDYGIVLPRRLQVEFAQIVQRFADAEGGEVSAKDLWRLFAETYLQPKAPIEYLAHTLTEEDEGQPRIRLQVRVDGEEKTPEGNGNGPIDAALAALKTLGITAQVESYEERAMEHGGNAKACAFVEVAANGQHHYGVGISENIVTASLLALISGINRGLAG
ncbi:MAG: 2-isopropylmalate synthase [Zoogloeaceae bacterium]|nr:2-isopropylmalate synthase [Zoogloeaceae bacterium]